MSNIYLALKIVIALDVLLLIICIIYGIRFLLKLSDVAKQAEQLSKKVELTQYRTQNMLNKVSEINDHRYQQTIKRAELMKNYALVVSSINLGLQLFNKFKRKKEGGIL